MRFTSPWSVFRMDRVIWMLCLALLGWPAALYARPSLHPQLLPLVESLCGRSIVLLGEESTHVSESALPHRAALVDALVSRCGFSQVLLEAPVYEMLAWSKRPADAPDAQTALRLALGGLWGDRVHAADLENVLLTHWRAGRITLGGIDPNVQGRDQHVTREALPSQLAVALPEPQRALCENQIREFVDWSHTPGTDADAPTIERCLAEIQKAASSIRPDLAMQAEAMAAMWRAANGAGPGARAEAMAMMAAWHRAQAGSPSKTVILAASVHVAKVPLPRPGSIPLRSVGAIAQAQWGDSVAAVAFTARDGHLRDPRGKTLTPLPPLPPEALEHQTPDEAVTLLGHEALTRLGSRPARIARYSDVLTMDWSQAFDAVIVLDEESPLGASGTSTAD